MRLPDDARRRRRAPYRPARPGGLVAVREPCTSVAGTTDRSGDRPSRPSMSLAMRKASRFLLGLPYRDTQCGFKLFPRHLVQDLFTQQRASGWTFDAGMFIAHRVSHLPIVEVPVVWTPRGVSRVRPGGRSERTRALRDGMESASRRMPAGRSARGRPAAGDRRSPDARPGRRRAAVQQGMEQVPGHPQAQAEAGAHPRPACRTSGSARSPSSACRRAG